MPELRGERPDPVLDPGPPVVGERHSGVGYEILLDVRVPQLDRDVTVRPGEEIQKFVEAWEVLSRASGLSVDHMLETVFGRRQREREVAEAAERSETSEEVGGSLASGSRSSKKMGGRRKRKKRRKKLPKTSSSTSSRRRAVDQGIMFEHGEDEVKDAEKIEYVQRADVLIIHSSDTCTLHAEPLNSVYCMKVMGYMEAMNKLIEEKGIAGDAGEEFVHKNGMPADSLYGDRAHMNIPWRCWPDWVKNRRQYVRRLGYAP